MPKLSAGLLLYRRTAGKLEVLIVHPGGPFWAKKDMGAWSLPKGEYTAEEDALAAAKREFTEETGHPAPVGEYKELGEVKYSNKIVYAWAVESDINAAQVRSNTFQMEWPPRSGEQQEFPEVDKAQWCDVASALKKLVTAQAIFVERLSDLLGTSVPPQLTLL